MIWFCWVLWLIKHCRLFNAKFSYIKYMICKYILLITFLNDFKLIISQQLNGSKDYFALLTIQLIISYLFTHS